MAEPNKVQRGGGKPKTEATPKDLGKAKSARVFAQFAKSLGINDLKLEDLGVFAKPFLKELTEQFTGMAAERGYVPDGEVVKAYRQLRELHQRDQFLAKPPADLSAKDGEMDAHRFTIASGEQRGQYKIAGGSLMRDTHAVARLFKELGIDPNGFGEGVAEVINFAADTKKNLSEPQTWLTFATQIAKAALTEKGTPGQKIAAAVSATVETARQVNAKTAEKVTAPEVKPPEAKKTYPKDLGATPKQGLGLEKTASRTSNTGSATNAFAIRAALLSGLNDQSERVERTAANVLGEIYKSLGVEPDRNTRRAIHGELKKLLSDRNSPDGKTQPADLMHRILDSLTKASPDNALLSELSGMVQTALAASPNAVQGEGFQEAFGMLAASSLSELVAQRLGVKPKGEGKLSPKLFEHLRELFSEPTEKPDVKQTESAADPQKVANDEKVGGSKQTPEIDVSQWSGDRPDIEQRFKDAALKMLMKEGMRPEHPRSMELMNAVGEVLQASFDPQLGEVHPGSFALNLQGWLAQFASGSQAKVEALTEQMSGAVKAHIAVGEALDSAKSRYQELQAAQNTTTSRENTAGLEKELEELASRIPKLEGTFQKGQADINRDIRMLQKDGLRRLSEFIIGGKCDNASGSQGGGGGGKIPPDGSGPSATGDAGGPKRKKYWARDEPSGMGAIAGFNTGGRPEDVENAKNLTIQQQRAIKCGEILADPTLTIEDKIFLFMMWFTAFTDKERESKLEELVQMDREAARIQKTKDEKLSELNSLRDSKKGDEATVIQAESALRRLERDGQGNASPDKLEAAQKAVGDAKERVSTREASIKMAEKEVSDLKAQQDQAPKSREVLFMEIERLNQLRDKIMNMARSIMENSNRNIEKIFR